MSDWKPDIERVRDEAQALVEKHHLVGMGVGLVLDGELAHAEGFGLADVAKGEPLRADHRQRIASISKTMVGLCAMALVDEGRLSLRDKVADLLPDIPFVGESESLTVWHLLTHTGGIGEAPMTEDIRQAFDKLFGESEPGVPLAQLYANGFTIEVPPGTKWAYANHGFTLLGEIIERIEKAPLPEVMERRVFGPLGMPSSDILDQPHPGLSRGYSRASEMPLLKILGVKLESEEPVDGFNVPGKFVRVWANGAAGAVQSTLEDMGRYVCALLRSSDGIVRKETFAAMVSDQWRPDERLPGWGLSFSVRTLAGHRMFSHGGSAFGGWNSHMAVFPDLNAALITHTNLWSDGFDTAVVPYMLRAFLGHGEPVLADCTPDPVVMESAPGVYELPMPGPLTNFRPQFNCGRVKLTAEEGALTLYSQRGAWQKGVRLAQVEAGQPDYFAMQSADGIPQFMTLLRDDGGQVTGLRFPQLVDMRRNPEMQPWT